MRATIDPHQVLIEWARLSIRGVFFSYVFSNDVPTMLWTGGPFAYIRNPFYTSYLLAMASVALMMPSLIRLFVFAGAAMLLRSGRFLPKILA